MRSGLVPDPGKRFAKVRDKLIERPFDAAAAADQHVVRAGHPALGQDRPSKLAEAPLHPVADDGAADLPRDREADPDRRIAVAPRPDEQDELRGRSAQAAIRGEIVRPAGEPGDRRRG